jgi:hypothetical protein
MNATFTPLKSRLSDFENGKGFSIIDIGQRLSGPA